MSGGIAVTVSGNLTADPELRTISGGVGVANFTIASTERVYDPDSRRWKDGPSFFMRCTAWRDLAGHVSSSLSKGMRVIATGRISQRTYEAKDGSTRVVVEMTVEDIGASLLHATSTVTRVKSDRNRQDRRQDGSGWNDAGDDPSDAFNQPAEW